jgi:hypothetical protein
MLENYRTDSANLEWWFEHKKGESLEEFIEGESLGAVDYGADKVQTSKEPDKSGIGLMCRMHRKPEGTEPDEIVEMIRADYVRLGRLKTEVYKLPSLERSIIMSRYYDGNSMRNVKAEFHYQKSKVFELISRAIQLLAERL